MSKTLQILLILLASAFSRVSGKDTQGIRIDSLLAAAAKMPEDTSRVWLLCIISHEYCAINPDEGLKWGAQALLLAQKLHWREGEAEAQNETGANYRNKGACPAALNAFFKALSIDESLGDKTGMSVVCCNIGAVYDAQKAFPKALEYDFKSLNIAEAAGDKSRIQIALGSIGGVYALQGSNEEAVIYLNKALSLAEELNDKQGIIINTSNIGAIYTNEKAYGLALKYEFIGLRAAKDAGYRQSIALNTGNIGKAYLYMAEDSILPRPDSLIPAGKAAIIAKSIEYLRQSLDSCQQSRFFEGIPEFSLCLSEALALKGDYKNALDAYQQFKEMSDSLHNAASNAQIANLETSRAVELKNKDIRIAELEVAKRRNQRSFLIAALLFVASVAGFAIRQSALRKKANERLALTNQQLDEANRVKARFFGILSHDLRAPISNLTSYLYLQREAPEMMDEKARASHQLTIELAANNLLSVMEDLLLWSKGQMTSFKPTIKSVQILQLFNEIKKLVPDKTATDVVFDDPGLLKIDTDENFLKTIMRNLTANALKALSDQQDGKVEWKAWEEGGKSFMSITDNGPGLTKEQVADLFSESAVTSAKTGLGLHIVRDFAKMLGQKIEVKSEVGKGTSFILSAAA